MFLPKKCCASLAPFVIPGDLILRPYEMKILAISILRFNEDITEPCVLVQATKLDEFGFFQRGSVKEMITFFSKTITARTPSGQRQSVQNEDYYVHVYLRADGLCGCVTCDAEYPQRVAYTLLGKCLEDFDAAFPSGTQKYWRGIKVPESITWPPLDQMITDFQDPAQADQMTRIQKNIDETRDVLHYTIDSMLQRGEKLEDLVDRSGN